jgi:hypothetical protein
VLLEHVELFDMRDDPAFELPLGAPSPRLP